MYVDICLIYAKQYSGAADSNDLLANFKTFIKLLQPITRKASEILQDKECRDVFNSQGLLHLLRILNYSKIPGKKNVCLPRDIV